MVEQVALLALDAEEGKLGKPILYNTKYEIAKKLGVSEKSVSLAMRLSYTAEFAEQYGFSFVPPGNGRSGDKYGYVLEHDKSKIATEEVKDGLDDNDVKLADHLRGSAKHWEMIRFAHGGNTTTGKRAARVAEILNGAAASVEDTLGQ
jgi:hypothetical protein